MEKEEYKKAPDIISSKDLDYLKDIFGWHYSAFKFGMNALDFIEDEQVIHMFDECNQIFYDHMKTVIDILEEGGKNNGE